jgi:hypothetical protein
MNTLRTLGFAAVAALSLGAGAAMAQEGANDTVSGATFFGNHAPIVQMQSPHQGVVSSGSSDVEMRATTNPQWQPTSNNEAGQG